MATGIEARALLTRCAALVSEPTGCEQVRPRGPPWPSLFASGTDWRAWCGDRRREGPGLLRFIKECIRGARTRSSG